MFAGLLMFYLHENLNALDFEAYKIADSYLLIAFFSMSSLLEEIKAVSCKLKNF